MNKLKLLFLSAIDESLERGLKDYERAVSTNRSADFQDTVSQRLFEDLVPLINALMAEASATALEDIDNYIDQVLFHQDEAAQTGALVGGRGPLICLFREKAKEIREKAGIVDTEI